jgi:hypothetical protein
MFNLVMIDEKRKVRIQIALKTETGDEVDIEDTIRSISRWINRQLLEHPDGMCKRQATPLMSQAAVAALTDLLGSNLTTFLLSDEATRYAIIHSMTMGYYLLKFLEKKGIKIESIEYPMTDEEIAEVKRVTARDCQLTRAIMEGRDDPKTIIRNMVRQGLLSQEDLQAIGIEDITSKEDNSIN